MTRSDSGYVHTSADIIPRSFEKDLFKWLKIVRVYTKVPGQTARPACTPQVFAGQSVSEICELVHKDFFEKLRFARLWRGSEDPVTVSRNELVMDGDMLELHI